MASEFRHPQRIQLSRMKGAKLPPNTVSVARPSKWGNPYPVGEMRPTPPIGEARPRTAEEAVAAFRIMVSDPMAGWLELARHELRGKNLACWCPLDSPCHADILLELANR